MKYILSLFILISLCFSQFKSDRQVNIESKILAPCCYNGIILEHNSDISNLISSIISSFISEDYIKKNILLKLDELILLSNKQITSEAKKKIYNSIHQKMNNENIIKVFINIFGDKISAIPPNNLFGKITWLMPLFLLIIAISLLSIGIKKIYYQSKKNKIFISLQDSTNIENMIKNYKQNLDL